MGFLIDHKWVLLFYGTIVLLLFIFRKKFEIHNKVIALYKTKIGLRLMDKIGRKHSELVKLIGYFGIGIGFIGMIVIMYELIKNLITLLSVPDAMSGVVPVIPGVAIPGSPIVIPLITGWIALFLVILVHEFSHGVVSRAHNIKVNSSGIFFLGPLMGAFVEPEEKALNKAPDTTQYSVFAAGPWSNVILALIIIFLLSVIINPILGSMSEPTGIPLAGITEGLPAEAAGLQTGMIISEVNGKKILDYVSFTDSLSCVKPNDTVVIVADDKTFEFAVTENPNNPEKGYLGVLSSGSPHRELKSDSLIVKIINVCLSWFAELLFITALLSLGIGLANLLPIGPVDGGRMIKTALENVNGKKKGIMLWKKLTIFTLLLLLINLFWPLIKWVGTLLGLLI